LNVDGALDALLAIGFEVTTINSEDYLYFKPENSLNVIQLVVDKMEQLNIKT